MPDFITELSKPGAWGCPWHGKVEGGWLTLPNGQLRNYPSIPGAAWSGCNFRLRVPGTVDVVRTPEEVAADTAAGRQWTPEALLQFSEATTVLHGGVVLVQALWLYAVAPGQVYKVIIPDRFQYASDGTLGIVKLQRYGELRETEFFWDPEEHDLVVPGTGFSAADNGWLFNASARWDVSATGDRAILMAVNDAGSVLDPAAVSGALLLTITGNGADVPYAVGVTALSRGIEAPDYSYTNSIAQRWRPFEWVLDAPTTYDPSSTARPRTETTTHNSVALVTGAEVSSPPGTQAFSYYTGIYTANSADVPVAFWLTETGVAAITASYDYSREHTFAVSGDMVGSPPRVRVVGIGADGSVISDTVTEAGSYAATAEAEVTTLETWRIELKVDGAALGFIELRYEHTSTWDFSDTVSGDELNANGWEPPADLAGAKTTINRALHDGVAWENLTSTVATAGLLNEYAIPRIGINPEQLAYPGQPAILWAGALYNVAGTRRLRAAPHWYSNHLVCMSLAELTVPGGIRQWGEYKEAAYPGGTYGTPFTLTGAQVPYGSWNPITTETAISTSAPVNWV